MREAEVRVAEEVVVEMVVLRRERVVEVFMRGRTGHAWVCERIVPDMQEKAGA